MESAESELYAAQDAVYAANDWESRRQAKRVAVDARRAYAEAARKLVKFRMRMPPRPAAK